MLDALADVCVIAALSAVVALLFVLTALVEVFGLDTATFRLRRSS